MAKLRSSRQIDREATERETARTRAARRMMTATELSKEYEGVSAGFIHFLRREGVLPESVYSQEKGGTYRYKAGAFEEFIAGMMSAQEVADMLNIDVKDVTAENLPGLKGYKWGASIYVTAESLGDYIAGVHEQVGVMDLSQFRAWLGAETAEPYSTTEIADELGIGTNDVIGLINSGELKAEKVRGRWQISPESYQAYTARQATVGMEVQGYSTATYGSKEAADYLGIESHQLTSLRNNREIKAYKEGNEWRYDILSLAEYADAQESAPARMSTSDVSEQLGISATDVRSMIEDGTLEATKINGRWQVTEKSVNTYIRDATQGTLAAGKDVPLTRAEFKAFARSMYDTDLTDTQLSKYRNAYGSYTVEGLEEFLDIPENLFGSKEVAAQLFGSPDIGANVSKAVTLMRKEFLETPEGRIPNPLYAGEPKYKSEPPKVTQAQIDEYKNYLYTTEETEYGDENEYWIFGSSDFKKFAKDEYGVELTQTQMNRYRAEYGTDKRARTTGEFGAIKNVETGRWEWSTKHLGEFLAGEQGEQGFLSTGEVAEEFGIFTKSGLKNTDKVRTWAELGIFPNAKKVNNQWRIPQSDVDAYWAQLGQDLQTMISDVGIAPKDRQFPITWSMSELRTSLKQELGWDEERIDDYVKAIVQGAERGIVFRRKNEQGRYEYFIPPAGLTETALEGWPGMPRMFLPEGIYGPVEEEQVPGSRVPDYLQSGIEFMGVPLDAMFGATERPFTREEVVESLMDEYNIRRKTAEGWLNSGAIQLTETEFGPMMTPDTPGYRNVLQYFLDEVPNAGVTTTDVTIERLPDGDTAILVGGESLRYLGVDAPEYGDRGWNEYRQANQAFIDKYGTDLKVEWFGMRDIYGRPIGELMAPDGTRASDFIRDYMTVTEAGPRAAGTDFVGEPNPEADSLFDQLRFAAKEGDMQSASQLIGAIESLGLSREDFHSRGFAAPGETGSEFRTMADYVDEQETHKLVNEFDEIVYSTDPLKQARKAEIVNTLADKGINAMEAISGKPQAGFLEDWGADLSQTFTGEEYTSPGIEYYNEYMDPESRLPYPDPLAHTGKGLSERFNEWFRLMQGNDQEQHKAKDIERHWRRELGIHDIFQRMTPYQLQMVKDSDSKLSKTASEKGMEYGFWYAVMPDDAGIYPFKHPSEETIAEWGEAAEWFTPVYEYRMDPVTGEVTRETVGITGEAVDIMQDNLKFAAGIFLYSGVRQKFRQGIGYGLKVPRMGIGYGLKVLPTSWQGWALKIGIKSSDTVKQVLAKIDQFYRTGDAADLAKLNKQIQAEFDLVEAGGLISDDAIVALESAGNPDLQELGAMARESQQKYASAGVDVSRADEIHIAAQRYVNAEGAAAQEILRNPDKPLPQVLDDALTYARSKIENLGVTDELLESYRDVRNPAQLVAGADNTLYWIDRKTGEVFRPYGGISSDLDLAMPGPTPMPENVPGSEGLFDTTDSGLKPLSFDELMSLTIDVGGEPPRVLERGLNALADQFPDDPVLRGLLEEYDEWFESMPVYPEPGDPKWVAGEDIWNRANRRVLDLGGRPVVDSGMPISAGKGLEDIVTPGDLDVFTPTIDDDIVQLADFTSPGTRKAIAEAAASNPGKSADELAAIVGARHPALADEAADVLRQVGKLGKLSSFLKATQNLLLAIPDPTDFVLTGEMDDLWSESIGEIPGDWLRVSPSERDYLVSQGYGEYMAEAEQRARQENPALRFLESAFGVGNVPIGIAVHPLSEQADLLRAYRSETANLLQGAEATAAHLAGLETGFGLPAAEGEPVAFYIPGFEPRPTGMGADIEFAGLEEFAGFVSGEMAKADITAEALDFPWEMGDPEVFSFQFPEGDIFAVNIGEYEANQEWVQAMVQGVAAPEWEPGMSESERFAELDIELLGLEFDPRSGDVDVDLDIWQEVPQPVQQPEWSGFETPQARDAAWREAQGDFDPFTTTPPGSYKPSGYEVPMLTVGGKSFTLRPGGLPEGTLKRAAKTFGSETLGMLQSIAWGALPNVSWFNFGSEEYGAQSPISKSKSRRSGGSGTGTRRRKRGRK